MAEMQRGRGAYDDIAEELVRRLQARGIVLLVLEGNRGAEGDGLSLIGSSELMERLPEILHGIANDLSEAQAGEPPAGSDQIILPPGHG